MSAPNQNDRNSNSGYELKRIRKPVTPTFCAEAGMRYEDCPVMSLGTLASRVETTPEKVMLGYRQFQDLFLSNGAEVYLDVPVTSTLAQEAEAAGYLPLVAGTKECFFSDKAINLFAIIFGKVEYENQPEGDK